MYTDLPCRHRSGKLCARYVRADLPLLDLASRAGLNSVLGIAIALAVLGAAALVAVAFIALRARRRSRYKRAPANWPPACVTKLPTQHWYRCLLVASSECPTYLTLKSTLPSKRLSCISCGAGSGQLRCTAHAAKGQLHAFTPASVTAPSVSIAFKRDPDTRELPLSCLTLD